jgi:hypothetical protein
MSKMIQFLLELLQVAGGDLHISKFACYTVFYHWKGGRATLLHTHDAHHTMTVIHPSSGDSKQKSRKNPNEAHLTLGWMMTTDGKSKAQFVMLKAKAKLFVGGIRQSRMQRYDATAACNLYYSTIIGYTLAATHLSIVQCKTIQSPVICVTLYKMGINMNVSHDIIFSPKYMGGMVIRHLHTLQGIQLTHYLWPYFKQ